jgi:hypothetical protein
LATNIVAGPSNGFKLLKLELFLPCRGKFVLYAFNQVAGNTLPLKPFKPLF